MGEIPVPKEAHFKPNIITSAETTYLAKTAGNTGKRYHLSKWQTAKLATPKARFFAAGFTNAIPSSSRPVRATFGSKFEMSLPLKTMGPVSGRQSVGVKRLPLV